MRGRHVSGSGYERDARKFNLAMMSGWKVFLLTSTTAKDSAWIEMIAAYVASQSGQQLPPSEPQQS